MISGVCYLFDIKRENMNNNSMQKYMTIFYMFQNLQHIRRRRMMITIRARRRALWLVYVSVLGCVRLARFRAESVHKRRFCRSPWHFTALSV